MRSPTRARVVYERNPLAEVIFQIRYPINLAIERDLPTNFQKALIDSYPLLDVKRGVQLQLKVAGAIDDQPFEPRPSRVYDFTDIERTSRVSLSCDSLSFSTTKYKDWDHFRNALGEILAAFFSNYDQSLFTRVGLRYVNAIKPAELGLSTENPAEIMNPELVAPLTGFTERVFEHQALTIIEIPDGKISVRMALTKDEQGESYIFDTDAFHDEMFQANPDDVLARLEQYHLQHSDLFRWAIGDAVHAALGPT
ncbi:TIGR04255 family protein [Phenylobacterium sp.]|uniref:TIGR04255 family protein n=1 Tax=Phenylobacterium sp. TaxID=1871053 RepID=UPI0035AE5C49